MLREWRGAIEKKRKSCMNMFVVVVTRIKLDLDSSRSEDRWITFVSKYSWEKIVLLRISNGIL